METEQRNKRGEGVRKEMTVIFVNESAAGESEEVAVGGVAWRRAELCVDIVAWAIAVPGAVGNVLCYLTCGYLPVSTSGYLMRHLALWDIVSQQARLLIPLMMNFGHQLNKLQVSIVLKINFLRSWKIFSRSCMFLHHVLAIYLPRYLKILSKLLMKN